MSACMPMSELSTLKCVCVAVKSWTAREGEKEIHIEIEIGIRKGKG